jgi:hypothetical protein
MPEREEENVGKNAGGATRSTQIRAANGNITPAGMARKETVVLVAERKRF